MKNVALVVVAVATIGGFLYFALFSTPANEIANEAENKADELSIESAPTASTQESLEGKGTLEYLRLLNKDMECTISYTNPEQQSTVEGTYFVSEGSMRGDFLTASPDLSGQILSSMIINNNLMYVWSEIEGGQYGITIDTSKTQESSLQSHEPISMNVDVAYNCKSWKSVDRTVFVPPTTVIFRTMDELMRGGMEYGNIYEVGSKSLE